MGENAITHRIKVSVDLMRRIQGFSKAIKTQIHQQYSNDKIKQNKINGNYWKIKPRKRIQSKLNVCVQQNNAEYNAID